MCFYLLISHAPTRSLITLIGQKYSSRLALLYRRQYWSRNMFNNVYVVYHVNITSNSWESVLVFIYFILRRFPVESERHKCCWLSAVFRTFEKMKKGKIMNKNSIKICKVFVTSLDSELRQCFPPLRPDIPPFAAGAGEVTAGIKRCPSPLKFTL